MSLADRMVEALGHFGRDGVRPEGWRLHAIDSRSVSVGVRDNEAGNAYGPLAHHQGESLGYLVRWSDGRVSRGAIDRGHGDPHAALDAALAGAYDDEDAGVIPGPADVPDVPLHSAGVARVVDGDHRPIRHVLDAARDLVRQRGYGLFSGSVHAVEARSEVRSSEGLHAETASTTWTWHMHFEGEFGDSVQRRDLGDPAEPARRLAAVGDLVDHLRRDGESPSGICPVVFHPRLVEALLDTYVFANLAGAAVWHGQSAFPREHFERRTRRFRPDLRIGVDPTRPWAFGSYRFTAEGVPAAATDFVLEGALVSPVLGLKFARRFGRAPTALPSAGDALVFEGPPRLSLAEALGQADRGIFALGLLGLHTQDPTRGEFSLAAPQALSIRAGELVGRAKVVLAGDFLGALGGPDLALVQVEDQPVPGLLLPCRVHPLAAAPAGVAP